MEQMEAMNQGDYSHLLTDIESHSHPEALQQLPNTENLTIVPTVLDQFMSALDKYVSPLISHHKLSCSEMFWCKDLIPLSILQGHT
jgi:hypothetical protein